MRDKGRIYIGLLVFLVLATVPIWYNVARSPQTAPPELVLPEGEGACMADADYMRREHMTMVMDWRDEVVRENDRIFTAPDGNRYYKSLTTTCLDCHENKDEFCDRCHDYLSVKPYCWECHVVPKGGQ
jgi:hypothetical protein